MTDRCLYFGCWNEPGHFLYLPGGGSAREHRLESYGKGEVHLDGTLAPRRIRRGTSAICRATGLTWGDICWEGMGRTREDRQRIHYDADECPQGEFLLHQLDTGFTAIQWWDRTQGDGRGACNGTLLLEGRRTSAELLAALAAHFPHVLANLTKAGVSLVEVHVPEKP
jgi:hypothetical protein